MRCRRSIAPWKTSRGCFLLYLRSFKRQKVRRDFCSSALPPGAHTLTDNVDAEHFPDFERLTITLYSDLMQMKYKVNWIFYKGRWYFITPLPYSGLYKLAVPGERGYVMLSKKQLERAVRNSFQEGNS